jgi:branched-chain amino acid transport system substrate-binding protein
MRSVMTSQNLYADAIGRAEKLDGESIKKALEETENFVGVTGTLSVDEYHNPVKSIVVIGLENGVNRLPALRLIRN